MLQTGERKRITDKISKAKSRLIKNIQSESQKINAPIRDHTLIQFLSTIMTKIDPGCQDKACRAIKKAMPESK